MFSKKADIGISLRRGGTIDRFASLASYFHAPSRKRVRIARQCVVSALEFGALHCNRFANSVGGTMSESIFDRISEFFTAKSAVQKVAEDPVLTAELLLLLHVALADGKTDKTEYGAILGIAETDFGIPRDEFAEVAEYLKDFGYETTSKQAVLAFADVPFERKVQLLRHLLTIANADNDLDPKEANLIRTTAELLGVTPEELHKKRG